MLFKEKLLLSNCDSVKRLNERELRKRFLTGLVFADGVVLTPNTLIDNVNIYKIITKKNVVKYLQEEGRGKFIVRGFGFKDNVSLVDYFNSLPSDYIVSSLPDSPRKSDLNKKQLDLLLRRLDLTQNALNNLSPKIEILSISKESLRNEIIKRICNDEVIDIFFGSDRERILFINQSEGEISRSQWYGFSDRYFKRKGTSISLRFKSEVIDPAYNYLFAYKGEGFLQDNIKVINSVPEPILDSGVVLKSLRNEIEYIEYPLKTFELISSLGSGELVKFLTDKALDYIEDRLMDKGEKFLSRKNWFGMYDTMKRKIGLEVK